MIMNEFSVNDVALTWNKESESEIPETKVGQLSGQGYFSAKPQRREVYLNPVANNIRTEGGKIGPEAMPGSTFAQQRNQRLYPEKK